MKISANLTTEDIVEILKKVDRQTWVKIGVAFLIFLVIMIIFIWPAWISRMEIRGKIKAIKGQIELVETLRVKKNDLMKSKETMLKFNQAVKERIFNPGEASLLLGTISKLAGESKVGVIASRPGEFSGKFPPPYDAQYEASLYEFSIEGGYHEMGNFVSRIETNPKMLRIQKFHILPNEEIPNKHTADLSMTAVSSLAAPKSAEKK